MEEGECMAIVRLAALDDVDELVQMRWDFSEEEQSSSSVRFYSNNGFSRCEEAMEKHW
jgi:hypothetical protein